MRRVLMAAAVLGLGVSAVMAQQEVAVQQQNLMKSQGKSMYGVLNKMVKGDTPFDKAAADADTLQTLEAIYRRQTGLEPRPT